MSFFFVSADKATLIRFKRKLEQKNVFGWSHELEITEKQYVFIPKELLLALTWTSICVLHPRCFLTMQTNQPQMDSAVHWWFTSCCFRGAVCWGLLGAAWSTLIGDSPLWLQPGITSSLRYIWGCCLVMKLSIIWIPFNAIPVLS